MRTHIDQFLSHLKATGYAPSTIEKYGCYLLRFLDFAEKHGISEISEVQRRLISDYQVSVSQWTSARGKPYSAGVKNLHVKVIDLLYAYLKAEGCVDTNPAERMTYAPERDWIPPVPPSPEVFIRLIEQPDISTPMGYRDRTMMEILYSSALRINELLSLRLSDVFLDDQKLKVIGKGRGQPIRYVPILDTATRFLAAYQETMRDVFVVQENDPAFVFLSSRGQKMSKPAFRSRLKIYATAAGINIRIYPHLFRHGALTHCLEGGADIRHLQELAGHKRLNHTAIYTHVSNSGLKAILNRCHPRETPNNSIGSMDLPRV